MELNDRLLSSWPQLCHKGAALGGILSIGPCVGRYEAVHVKDRKRNGQAMLKNPRGIRQISICPHLGKQGLHSPRSLLNLIELHPIPILIITPRKAPIDVPPIPSPLKGTVREHPDLIPLCEAQRNGNLLVVVICVVEGVAAALVVVDDDVHGGILVAELFDGGENEFLLALVLVDEASDQAQDLAYEASDGWRGLDGLGWDSLDRLREVYVLGIKTTGRPLVESPVSITDRLSACTTGPSRGATAASSRA
jgi:hypothetical protein